MFLLLRKNRVFFAVFLLAASVLRLLFVAKMDMLDGDTFLYGELAKNWLIHGTLGFSSDVGAHPTYIRLPGYPAFLAAIWSVTGVEHYRAVEIVQVLFDLGTCFLIADIARRVASDRAAKIAFALAALCPFTAIYVAEPLTETLAIFFTALAIDFVMMASEDVHSGQLRYWIGSGAAIGAGILLRPDGGILLVAICLYLLLRLLRRTGAQGGITDLRQFRVRTLAATTLVASVALAPLVPWAIRNWRHYDEFQPLAPRYATEPDEPVNEGYQRWIRSWAVDYSSVVDVYWCIPGEPVDPVVLPSRAFDSESERQQTLDIFAEYNRTLELTPQMDFELGKIADARVRRNSIRYYLVLPALRVADMWLRPRIDVFEISDRWWNYNDDPQGTWMALFLGLLNIFLIGAAIVALFRFRKLRFVGLLVLFVGLRSLFLGSLENPETRYTLECYPVVLALAAVAFTHSRKEIVKIAAESPKDPEVEKEASADDYSLIGVSLIRKLFRKCSESSSIASRLVCASV